jgi:hypothetical protein
MSEVLPVLKKLSRLPEHCNIDPLCTAGLSSTFLKNSVEATVLQAADGLVAGLYSFPSK